MAFGASRTDASESRNAQHRLLIFPDYQPVCILQWSMPRSHSTTKTEGFVRKLVLKMSVSVDGFVGGPNGEIDWIFGSLDDAASGWMLDTLWDAGVHIMGSRTF